MSDKRELIMDAALKLFCEHGFQNTSTANISREAGVATGTLFLYFPSKEGLINTLYIESKKELAIYLKEGLTKQKSTKLKIRHTWMRAIEWATENPYAFRFIHMFSSSPYISNLSRKKVASTSDFAEKFVLAGIKEGILARINTPLFFSVFDGLWTSTVNHVATLRSQKNKQKIVEQSFEIFWKGVSK
jgi:AcrR family transcriptional regulator